MGGPNGPKGRFQVGPDWRLPAWGGWKQASQEQGILCHWSRGRIWPSLAGPKLEAGSKIEDVLFFVSAESSLEKSCFCLSQ